MTTQSQNPELAWGLAQYMASEEAGLIFWNTMTKFPANSAAIESLRDDPIAQAWVDILPTTVVPIRSVKYPEIERVLGRMQQEILLGEKDVETAVAEAHAEVDAIVKQ